MAINELVISDGVTEIQWNSIQDKQQFERLVVPASCATISNLFLDECTNLREITVNDTNPEYTSADGVLFSKDMKIIIRYPASKKGGSYEIPDSVEIIGKGAFLDCVNLNSIKIPKSVIRINTNAFTGCEKLERIDIHKDMKYIERGAFEGCTGLKTFAMHRECKARVIQPKGSNSNGFSGYYSGILFCCRNLEWLFLKDETTQPVERIQWIHSSPTRARGTNLLFGVGTTLSGSKDNINIVARNVAIQKVPSDEKAAYIRGFLTYSNEYPETIAKGYIDYIKRSLKKWIPEFFNNPDYMRFMLQNDLIKKTNIDELIEYAQKQEKIDWVAFLLDWKNKNVAKKKGIPSLKPETHSVGDIITLGHYSWGTTKTPIEWIIVEEMKNQYLVVSKYLVREMPFYSGDRNKEEVIGWSKSDVRSWLNGEFFTNSFSDEERKRICLKKNRNKVNDDDTEDYIMLPSESEFDNKIGRQEAVKEKLQYKYGANGSAGEWEMLRKTWRRYYQSCVEIRYRNANYSLYFTQTGTADEPYWIRPMMWIYKEGEDAERQKEKNVKKKEGLEKIKKDPNADLKAVWKIEKWVDRCKISNYKGSAENLILPEKYEGLTITEIDKSLNNKNRGYDTVKSIVLPKSLKIIRAFSFSSCSSLETVEIPDSVERIEEGAFLNCKELKTIVIGKGVNTIGREAFKGCEKLKEITIPESVVRITDRTFQNCSSLEKVIFENRNKIVFHGRNNIFFGSKKVKIYMHKGTEVDNCPLKTDQIIYMEKE